MSIDLKTAKPVVERSDGSYEPAEQIDMKTAEPVETRLVSSVAKDMTMEALYSMPILGPFSPKQIETPIKVVKEGFSPERSAAFKWFAMGMPEDLKSIEKAESMEWSNVMRESPAFARVPEAVGSALDAMVKGVAGPAAKFPEGELKETLKEFPTEIAGDVLEYGTDPVSYLMAYSMQVGFEKGIPVAMRKLSEKAPQLFKILTKQRGNTQALASAFDELGLKSTASETEIRMAYRKQSLKYHPDKGGNPDIFGKKADAYKTIMEAREPLLKEIQTMYKNSRIGNTRGSIGPADKTPKGAPKKVKFKTKNGVLEVWDNSPYSPDNLPSITNFVVDEAFRGKGEGSKLIDEAVAKFPNMVAQTTNIKSHDLFYKKGFRPFEADAKTSLEQSREMFKEQNTLLMQKPQSQAPEQVPDKPIAGTKERGFVTSVKAEKPELLHKVAGQYIPRSTDELAIKARTLIEEDIATAERMAEEGTDDASIAVGAELLKYYTDEADKAASPTLKDAMLDRASELAHTMAEKLTELGRSVQAASILARMTPEGQLKFAAKTIKKYNEDVAKQKGGLFGVKKPIPELTPQQTEHIITEMKAIQTMPDGEDKAIRFKDLQDYITDLVPTGIKDKIISLWKTGLLSSPTTHLKNISANTFFAGTEALKDIPATVVDRMISLVSKRITKVPTFKGYGKGVVDGMRKGYRFIKTGYDERNVLNKYDYRKVNYGNSAIGKGLQRYSDTIFRLLGAEDQPFYYGAKMRSLYEQAKVDGINKGLKGKELQKNTDYLVMNPTEEMALLATEDAKIAVFQNETVLGKAARQIQKVGDNTAEFILPFGRTPSAVATQIINYTPVGAIKTLIQNMGKGRFDQKSFSEGMGRAITGTVAMGTGSYLFLKGMMTLDRPTSKKEKDLWEAEGRKPNSIMIGGKWRGIESFGPLGNVLLIGGHFAKAYKKTGSVAGALLDSEAYFGSAKSFTEQTFLTGIKQALNAITDPDRSAEYFITSLVGSTVPSIVAKTATGIDPTMRRTNNVIDRLKSRIPFLSLSLEPRVDVLGQEIKRSSNFAELMLDPTAPQQMKGDPVVKELRRLTDAKMDIKTTKLGGRKGYEALTPKENTQLLKDAGGEAYSRIKELMSDKNYKAIPEDEKATRINEIFSEAKERARVNMAIQVTQGLKGDELDQKLIKLIKSKLLTRSLFEEYKSMR